ncbi:immunoglobulin lambda-1 light chain-like [Pygocentrus nattereri]|uniref:immunoglobulin lambda-1 light chain-like n=1 Tax=Pygocentrus nattereri TaxID=42514 RepID=UPI001891CE38|nr:immunoglobulin lambda-1 light chain-like [Pygocentrus nattereri]
MIMTLKATSVAGLLLTLSGLEAIVHLTQEKSIDFTLGQDVQILCRRDGGSWSISWYQQKAGGTPTFILADSYRASGLPSRFTYTDNGSDEYLNINGVQAEDEAVYYCGCIICQSHGSIGQGTELRLARPASPPSLALLAPSQSVQSGDEVSVVCMARGFHPDSVALSWAEDGSAVAGPDVQTGSSQRQPDGTFSQSSILKLNAGRWSSGRTYTCSLTHPALTSTLTKSVSVGQCS